MENYLISVNLLLYKPGFYLQPCLESIFAQSYDNFELLIIDNNSEDGTPEEAKKIIDELRERRGRPLAYKIIVNKKNLGFAAGQNQGIRESKGQLVALVNQDVVLGNSFLANIAEAFGEAEVGSAQGKILRFKVGDDSLTKTDMIDTTGFIFLKNRRIIARGQGQKDSGQYNKNEEIFGADGALPVYRRSALEDVKLIIKNHPLLISSSRNREGEMVGAGEYFDEDFYMYKEDVDLAWRLRLYGWKSLYIPSAKAWHARTAGDSAATNYLAVVRERLKINRFGKYHSFKNQRLMQIKNEQSSLLLKHIFYWLPKEIASWFYVILFEHYTWKSIRELFGQAPRAWEKRKAIMSRKKIDEKEMKRWFR